ncbi:hypothetical protein ACFPN2_12650 [Steroidobacter flavus]|uniref:Uncharacterized protein n=1 Tax=Steroidobacter flavus TaxID=1842136 RepID=A0ABV8SSH0_9GAMM
MSDRGNRRRISDGGLIFITMMVTILLCALWVAASADAADTPHAGSTEQLRPGGSYACHEGNYALPGILAGARGGEKR